MPALLIGTTLAIFAWTQDAGEKHKGHGQEKAGEHQKGEGQDKADEHAGHNHAPAGPAVGEKAEDFTTKTMSGKQIQLHKDFKGKLVLLDFWATWCPPCIGEIPHLREANKKYGEKGLVIVGITLDGSKNIATEKVSAFTKKKEMPWAQVYDDAREIAMTYQIQFIPTPFLIDGDSGKIIATKESLMGATLDKTLNKHVAAKMKEIKRKGGTSTP